MKRKNRWIDYIILLVFLGGVAYLYYLKIENGQNYSTTESNISDLVEFFLTFGIGLILQKISSFQDLKDFALSAYTRVVDTMKIIDRLSSNVDFFRRSNPKNKDFEIIKVSVDNLKDTIQSSKKDWVFIIGEEIEKTEKIEELQRKENNLRRAFLLNNDAQIEKKIESLKNDISELKSELPFVLRDNLFLEKPPFHSDFIDDNNVLSNDVLTYYLNEIKTKECIEITVDPIEELPDYQEKFPNLIAPLFLMVRQESDLIRLIIFNREKKEIGEIENPLPDVESKLFSITLFTIISSILKYTPTMSITPSLDTVISFPPNSKIRVLDGKVIVNLVANEFDLAFG